MSDTDRAHAIKDAADGLAHLAELNLRTCRLRGARWELFEDVVGEYLDRLRELVEGPNE